MTLVLLMLTAAEQITAAGLLTAESQQQLYIHTINHNNPKITCLHKPTRPS